MKIFTINSLCVLTVTLVSKVSFAGDVTSWSFDVASSGEDVYQSFSPAVDPNGVSYFITQQIEGILVDAQYGFLNFTDIDATALIDPEYLYGDTFADGPCPLVAISEQFIAPEASAVVTAGLGAKGNGFFEVTNVNLGSTVVDIGFPIGEVQVDITRLRVTGTMTCDPSDAPICEADVNLDGNVNIIDVLAIIGDFGSNDLDLVTDINEDLIVNTLDLLAAISALGPC